MTTPFTSLTDPIREALELRRSVREAKREFTRLSAGLNEHFESTGTLPEGLEKARAQYLNTQCVLLMRAARRWDVEVPSFDGLGPDSKWEFYEEGQQAFLTGNEQLRLWREVRKAKRATIGWYVQNVVSVLGALAGVIGAITGLVVVWK